MKPKNSTAVSLRRSVGILSVFFLTIALGSITPAMNKMVEFYGAQGIPMTTIMYVTSLPQLASVVGGLLSGIMAGKRLSFKHCAIIGILLFLIGGVTPVLFTNFISVLITRMIFGVGYGFLMVLGNPLISAFYTGDMKAKMLSVSTFVTFGGTVVMQALCGVFADIALRFAFLTHLVAVIPLIFVLLFLEEPFAHQMKSEKNVKKESLSGRVIFIAILFGLMTMCVMPLYINLAVFVGKVNTLATVAASVQILYSIGNMIGGLCFAIFYKYLKRFSMGISCIIMSVGMILMLTATGLPQMCIAMFIAGFGYGGLMPASLMIAGLVTKPSQTAVGTSIVMIGMNVLGFFATPVANMIGNKTGDALTAPVFAGTVTLAVIGVFLLVVNPFPKRIKIDK